MVVTGDSSVEEYRQQDPLLVVRTFTFVQPFLGLMAIYACYEQGCVGGFGVKASEGLNIRICSKVEGRPFSSKN